ncbi:hypothetical protein V6N12_021835 [Hibiscus sabdariffa]|uniref:Uncharacterized protein n=1 Tax=Hibiscus sabdariffa TaxID=183260 RepID=A0ABR2FTM3_9ROSI
MSDLESGKKTKTSLGSAEETGHNEDLITEILLNLPTKSLIKFKVAPSSPQLCSSSAIMHRYFGESGGYLNVTIIKYPRWLRYFQRLPNKQKHSPRTGGSLSYFLSQIPSISSGLGDGFEADLEGAQGSTERSSYLLQRRPCC